MSLEQKVQQQAMMLDHYHNAEMRWSVEKEQMQFLEEQVRQMWDKLMKPDSTHAVGTTCPYDSTDCSGPVTRNIPNAIAACNQETPVISSIFPVNSTNSKQKRPRKGRKK